MIRNGFALVLAVLLPAAGAVAQRTAPPRQESVSPVAFAEVKGQPDTGPSSFAFLAGGYEYRIASDGRGRRSGPSSRTRTFNLRLGGDFLDRVIYHAEHRGDLLLVCEANSGGDSAGFIARLDGRNLRLRWKRLMPAFNVGRPLMEGDYAYLTTHGFVAKINLNTGTYVWRHDNLYRDDSFNSFELPRVEGDVVTFTELPALRSRAKTMTVRKQSGKIIKAG